MMIDRRLCIIVVCAILLRYHQLCAQEKPHPGRSADLYAGYCLVAPDFGDYNGIPADKGVVGGADLHVSRRVAAAAGDRGMGSPSFEVSGGFAIAGGGTVAPGIGFNAGIDARAHGPLYLAAETTWFSVPHEAADGASDTAILAGPRYRRGGATAVFADFLAGAYIFHNRGQPYTWAYNDGTNFALATDLGADVAWGDHLAIRPQGGYFFTPLTNSTYGGPANPAHTSLNRARFGIGLAYRF